LDKKKIYNFLSITSIHNQLSRQANELNELREIIKERTKYHIDVHQKSNSQVILIGKYHNRDFVKCYNIHDKDLDYLIDHCIKLEKYSTLGKIDAMPELNAVINNLLGY